MSRRTPSSVAETTAQSVLPINAILSLGLDQHTRVAPIA